MRFLAGLAPLVIVVGCEALPEASPPPTVTAATSDTPDPHPLHTSDASCFPRTMALLDQAALALNAKNAVRGEALVRDAEAPFRDELHEHRCATDIGERVRARRLALRYSALRTAGVEDIELVLDLGSESFATSDCHEELQPLCADALAWFGKRYPGFVEGSTIAVRPMDRLPITPQPGGRLTVEYMQTVDNRLGGVDGDVFAMTIDPTVRIDAPTSVELRVDGSDVMEESEDCVRLDANGSAGASSASARGSLCAKERKAGAHVSLTVPAADLVRAKASGPVVVLVKKSDFKHSGATWRAAGRLAFSTR